MNRTALEMCFLILYRKVKYISRIDNNDCEDITLERIRNEILSFDENLIETFGKKIEDLFK